MSNVTSQSELTTKEIVEQAISDYHESILPYLNGMVPTIANKFDKANLYSEDEQIIGRWIDGKPLYQKTITGTTTSSAGNANVNIGCTIDTLVRMSGAIEANADGWCSFHKIGSDVSSMGVTYDRTKIAVYVNYQRAFNKPFKITIQYTKTTDEAIAIGSDTDYSLEEKIVGTDIDGKPIYKKTVNVSFTPAYAGGTGYYAYYDNLNVGINNIANIIKCEGRNTVEGRAMNYWAVPSSTANCINLRCINVLWPADKLTLWYTKTTD